MAAVGLLAAGAGILANQASASQAAIHDTLPAKVSTLQNHGGSTLPKVNFHIIWWGNTASFPKDEKTAVTGLLEGINSSNYLNISKQYLGNKTPNVNFKSETTWVDPTTPPSGTVTADTLAKEVNKYLKGTGRATSSQDVYVVATTANISGDECAWHSARTIQAKGKNILTPLIYLPTATDKRCQVPSIGDNTSGPTRAALSSLAHELVETMTDPIPGATWTDNAGQEVSDLCANNYGKTTLRNGQTIPVQGIWDNKQGRCRTA